MSPGSFCQPPQGPDGHSARGPDATVACLIKAIEGEILPRLMAAHRDAGFGLGGRRPSQITEQNVHDFTDIAIGSDSSRCRQYIDALRDRGVPVQSIYLQLLTPAARRLDAMWASDACDFTQITIALWHMQQAIYDLSPSFRADMPDGAMGSRTVMLTPVPGSQHTMGILMVAEFFRRSGWGVWSEPASTRERLMKEIRSHRFDVAGISVGSEAQLPELDRFIDDLRQSSKNKSLAVLVGGPMFAHRPDLAQAFGADGTAIDAETAVQKAEELLARRVQPAIEREGLRVG